MCPGSGERVGDRLGIDLVRHHQTPVSGPHERPGSCFAHGDTGVATSVRNAASTLTIPCFRRPRRHRDRRRGGVMARKCFASCPGRRSRRRSPRCRARPRSRAAPRGATRRPRSRVSVGLAGDVTVAPTVRWMIRPEELPRQATLGCTEPNEKGRTHRHGTPTANAAANCRCEHRRNAMSAYRAKRRAEWQRPAAQAASGGHRWAYPARQFPPQHPQRGDRALRYRPARHPQGRATHA